MGTAVSAGIYMIAGTVQNCIVAGNTNSSGQVGGGIYMYDGMVSNCLIAGNAANAPTDSRGGGIFVANPCAAGVKVVNCIITTTRRPPMAEGSAPAG